MHIFSLVCNSLEFVSSNVMPGDKYLVLAGCELNNKFRVLESTQKIVFFLRK
jgi:hypothetical protein